MGNVSWKVLEKSLNFWSKNGYEPCQFPTMEWEGFCAFPFIIVIVVLILILFLWVLFSSECFCAVTSADIQRKIAIGTGKKRKVPPEERLSVEKVADRFNQVTYLSTE